MKLGPILLILSIATCLAPIVASQAYIEQDDNCAKACKHEYNAFDTKSTAVKNCKDDCHDCLMVNSKQGEYKQYTDWGCPKANYSVKKKRCSDRGRTETVPKEPYKGCKAYKG